MSEVYAVAIEGLSALKSIDDLPDDVLRSARMAVNATIRRTQTAAARSMESQINFPRGYLTGQKGRLSIAKFASDKDLEGKIVGRDRPTSLARFITGATRTAGSGAPRAAGVTVEVKPGIAKRMPKAFVMKLRNGNTGLAVRTKDGRAPSQGAKLIAKGLYLLYGPSVDQVFVKTREYVKDDAEAFMQREFERLVAAGI